MKRELLNKANAARVIAIIAAAMVLSLPIIVLGLPDAHDVALNLVWSQEFAKQVLGGDLYPRWLSGINAGAGSPTFYFYGPFPFYVYTLTALLYPWPTVSIGLAVTETLIFAASGLALFFLLRKDLSPAAACAAAVVYLLLPYHLEVDLWRRQAFAEFTAYFWIPLILLSARQVVTNGTSTGWLAITYAGLVYTHAPTTLLFSPFLLVYAAIYSPRDARFSGLLRFSISIMLALGLAAPYLIPALTTQDMITPERWWTLSYSYTQWLFLDGRPEYNPEFGQHLFDLLILTTGAAFVFRTTALKCPNASVRPLSRFAMISILVPWIFMSPISLPVWDILPTLQKVQFPWRLAVMIDMATAALAGLAAHCLLNRRTAWRPLAFAVAVLVLACTYLLHAESRVFLSHDVESGHVDTDVAWKVRYRRGAAEYLPHWANPNVRQEEVLAQLQRERFVVYDQDSGNIDVLKQRSDEILLRANLTLPTALTVRQYYYPTWDVRIDGGESTETNPSDGVGLLQFIVPAGEHFVRITLIPLQSEQVGKLLAGIATIILLVTGWNTNRSRRHSSTT